MNELYLSDIRQSLEAERLNLLRTLQDQEPDETDENNSDEIDAANDSAEAEVRQSLDHFSADMLERIDHALERLDAGTYGKCLGCGQEISPERLQAIPYAELCVSCQSKLEERRKP